MQTARGVSIFYKERYLYSKYDPIKSAVVCASQIEVTKNTLYIVASPLLCYGLKELVNNAKEASLFLLTEKEDELCNISKTESLKFIATLEESDPKFKGRIFYSHANNLDFDFIYDLVRAHSIRKATLVTLNGALYFNQDYYNKLRFNISCLIQKWWQNKSTLNFLSSLWYQNILLNLKALAASNNVLFPSSINPLGLPIFLAAAGESLESRIDFLKANKNSHYLICVDTALPVLLSNGITPNLVIALEAQHHNLKDLLVEKNKLVAIPLLCDLSASPCFVRQFKKVIFFSTVFDRNKFLLRLYSTLPWLEKIPPLGNVGNAAIYIATKYNWLHNQKENIEFGGYDFCYINGKSHARGSCYHKMILQTCNKTNAIENRYHHSPSVIEQKSSLSFCNDFNSSKKDLVSNKTMIQYQSEATAILNNPTSLFSDDKNSLFNQNIFSHTCSNFDLNQTKSSINIFLQKEKELLTQFLEDSNDSEVDYLRECFVSNLKEENKAINILKEKIVASRLLKAYS